MPKSVCTTLITTSKFFKAQNTTIKTFALVFKVDLTDFGTRSKVFQMQNNAFKTSDLVIKVGISYFGTRLKVFKLIELVPWLIFSPIY